MLKMQRKLGDDEDKYKACETVIRFEWKNIDFYGKWNEMYLGIRPMTSLVPIHWMDVNGVARGVTRHPLRDQNSIQIFNF